MKLLIGACLLAALLASCRSPLPVAEVEKSIKGWEGKPASILMRQQGLPEKQYKSPNGNEVWEYRYEDDECRATYEVDGSGNIVAATPVLIIDCPKKMKPALAPPQ